MVAASKPVPVSKKEPCPVCGGNHKCAFIAKGRVICGRMKTDQPGWKCLGPCKDPQWHTFGPELYERETAAKAVTPAADTRPDKLLAIRDEGVRNLTDETLLELAGLLQIPADAFHRLPGLGYSPAYGQWLFPECDANGAIIGMTTRSRDGTKKCIPGSSRGLTLPLGWRDTPGPVFLVEGMSDAVALAHCGLSSVGRPSNTGGIDHLIPLVGSLEPGRVVVVMGENDEKPDGSWPGRDGAEFIATRLSDAHPKRTILKALPPDGIKDARAWVLSRKGQDFAQIGQDIAATMGRAAAQVKTNPHALPAPSRTKWSPIPITSLAPSGGPTPWVWDGFLARGSVTLLSALPKCGKTTLVTHLLKALPVGGEFCGRALVPGSAVVVTEESAEIWHERQMRLGLTDAVRLIVRPFMGRPDEKDWTDFLRSLMASLEAHPADVVILDTLADLWPVRDENSATEMTAAMKPLRALADGRSVLAIHHLRKSDGAEGTGSRGSGALAGFVDVIAELRRPKQSQGGGETRRVLSAVGRAPGIPSEWVVELKDGSFQRVPEDECTRAKANDEREEERICELRQAIQLILGRESDLTADEIWERLPSGVKVNQRRFSSVLPTENGKLWVRKGGGNRPYVYSLTLESGEKE